MNTKDAKEKLKEELQSFEQGLSDVGRKVPDQSGEWEATPGEIDSTATETDEVADKLEQYEDNEGVIKELEARWKDVKQALERIEKGNYGICEIGGEPIEEDRLMADPAATTCKAHLE